MMDKRLFSRFKLQAECSWAFKKDLRVFNATLEDLSLGGLRISTDTPLSPGQEIIFSIPLKPPIKGTARVVWVKKEGPRYSAGLEIVEMKEKFRKNLQDLINQFTLSSLSDAHFR
ncbi:MAG TPA: PilZ domain-containing protein [Thermodesulfatator atlanticus]|uniref:PilZ domain-containing protein n=1 Tax=Thermodesulfatator atlanticus TaxID=501497 RepID=A0A7V5P1X7_9BACT|nr:PilZ domain-containing protein [Thermodesulfatator atlanticus]